MISLALLCAAAALGATGWWIASGWIPASFWAGLFPRRTGPRRPGLVQRLQAEFGHGALPLPSGGFLIICILSGLLAYALTLQLRNSALSAASLAAGLLPYAILRSIFRARARKINRAWGTALVQLQKLAVVYPQPLPLLRQALPMLPEILRREIELALADHRANVPLVEALHQAADRLAGSFYAHQLAELSGLTIREGANLADGLSQLVTRYQTQAEIFSAQRVRVGQTMNFAWGVAALGLGGTLLYLAAARPDYLDYFIQYRGPAGILAWAVISTVALLLLPTLLRVDDAI